jgi:5-methylcytosine-specific restriction endonuclease McrA
MFAYCVGKLGFSEDVAFKRIRAARVARKFPAVLDAVADGRLHVAAIVLLSPHLLGHVACERANELLAAATGKTKRQVEELLAARFPSPDMPTRVRPILAPMALGMPDQHEETTSYEETLVAPGPVAPSGAPDLPEDPVPLRPLAGPTAPLTPGRSIPLAPERYALQFTISREAHERLRRVQDLLASAVTSSDIPEVFERALELLEHALKKSRFSAAEHPRASRASTDPRHLPAAVQRKVWARDGGRCTFVSEDGHRCEATRWLECDHVLPVARGGKAVLENLRLRCKAHNQYAAEQVFGEAFMRGKREQAHTAAPA